MKERLVNLSPHSITILNEDNEVVRELPPRPEDPPRVEEEVEELGTHAAVPIVKKTFGEIKGLPEPKKGVLYITSALVAKAASGRDDLLVPNTIRDEDGNILGCRSFSIIPG